MRSNYPGFKIFSLLVCLLTGIHVSAQSVQITGSSFPSLPATSCTNTHIDIDVQLSQSNIAHAGNSVSVSGSTITVDLDYTSSGFGTPVITNTTENVNLGMLPPGSYTVVMNGILNGNTTSTANNTLSVASCCPATSVFTASRDTICVGDSVYFNNTSTGAVSQSWYENNSFVDSSLHYGKRYNTPGSYAIKLVVSDGSCQDSTTKTILVSNPPSLDLGVDTGLCAGGSLLLDAGAGHDSLQWSDMSVSRTLSVDSPGVYHVKVYKNSCEASDSISVGMFPSVQVDLGKDTTICYGDSILLDATVPGASYHWQDSSAQNSFTAGAAGLYTVEVTDSNGCTWGDSIQVSMDSCETGLADNFRHGDISVYPNPAKDRVRLTTTFEKDETCIAEVYDLTGSLKLRESLLLSKGKPAELVISELKPGAYILRLESSGFTAVHSLIKQ